VSEGSERSTAGVYDEWGCDPRAPLAIRLAAAGIAGLLRLVYATARGECLQPEFHERAIDSPGGAYIGVIWHRHIGLGTFFYPRKIPRVCLVSRSRDGELLARTVAWLGSRCVRGSSSALDGRNKGGAAALHGMARAAEAGFHLIVTPDGPKGPPERIKPGVITLGAMTGRPIVPLGFAVSRFARLPTWDGTLIPLPFARMILAYGEPLEVPRTNDSEVLESRRAELERRLLETNSRALASLERSGR